MMMMLKIQVMYYLANKSSTSIEYYIFVKIDIRMGDNTIYSFGGRLNRQNRAANPINRNDRQFTCGFSTCSLGTPSQIPPIDRSDLFNLDFTVFNTVTLRENLDIVSSNIKNIYDAYITWLRDREAEFELKVNLGDVKINNLLFTKINTLISKITQGKRILADWYSNFQNLVIDLSDLLTEYNEATAKVESLYITSTGVSGLPVPVTTVAKQNLSKSKSIQRQITKILALDSKIRSAIQTMTFKIRELYGGILRSGNKTININDLGRSIDELSAGESPLARIQTQLSEIINSTPMNFTLRTARPPAMETIQNDDLLASLNRNVLNENYIINKLNELENAYIYTENTKPALDAAFAQIQTHPGEFHRFNEMIAKIDAIKNNVPHVVIENLRAKANNPEDIYVTIDRILNVRRNLHPGDVIYAASLEEIYNNAIATARRLVGIEEEGMQGVEEIIQP